MNILGLISVHLQRTTNVLQPFRHPKNHGLKTLKSRNAILPIPQQQDQFNEFQLTPIQSIKYTYLNSLESTQRI